MTYKVGSRTIAYSDPARPRWGSDGSRPLLTNIWYPAQEDAVEVAPSEPPGAAPFQAARTAPDAAIAPTPDRFPLILFSHGTGGTARVHDWLTAELARHGSIVAGVNHHGNTALEPYRVEGFARVWERPLDMSRVLDCLLADALFGPRIEPSRIGAAGFSLGGYTVLALAGGVIDLADFIRFFEASGRDFSAELPPEFPDHQALTDFIADLAAHDTSHKQSFRDERIRAAFAISPALGPAFVPEALARIRIPVRIIVGEADTSAPPAANSEYLASHIPGADLIVLPGGVGHYTFLAEATAKGKEILPELATDAPGVNRQEVHQKAAAWAVEFFDRTLPPVSG